ncbi:MAG: HDOD domain-containing protein [Verrucomicrobiota bacterium]
MSVLTRMGEHPCAPLPRETIEARVSGCARLPSLRSVDSALRDLLGADQRYTQQISEVIRRDPSLTSRLLRLVNSVYYGFSTPIKSIEEAVFYLGVRQIRQLAMVTPVVEDFQRLAGNTPFGWRRFWQHCIGTAMLTREVTNLISSPDDEVDYVAGLVHDVGVIVMSSAFSEHFRAIYCRGEMAVDDIRPLEREVLGMDHAELGAIYLEQHRLPQVLVDTARYHQEPERAAHHAQIIAAVQIADGLARSAGIDIMPADKSADAESWMKVTGWGILFPRRSAEEHAIAQAQLRRSMERLPQLLEGLV